MDELLEGEVEDEVEEEEGEQAAAGPSRNSSSFVQAAQQQLAGLSVNGGSPNAPAAANGHPPPSSSAAAGASSSAAAAPLANGSRAGGRAEGMADMVDLDFEAGPLSTAEHRVVIACTALMATCMEGLKQMSRRLLAGECGRRILPCLCCLSTAELSGAVPPRWYTSCSMLLGENILLIVLANTAGMGLQPARVG